MRIVIIFAIFCLVSYVKGSVEKNQYCVNKSSLAWDKYSNQPSIIGTFVNCIANVQDVMLAPYFTNGLRINVSTEILLNHLIQVDELANTVTLDFFFKMYWVKFGYVIVNELSIIYIIKYKRANIKIR